VTYTIPSRRAPSKPYLSGIVDGDAGAIDSRNGSRTVDSRGSVVGGDAGMIVSWTSDR